MDSIGLTLKNYSRLRDKHERMKMPPKGMSTIDASLELIRILFAINELLNLEGPFITKFEELLKKEELFCEHPACKVESTLIRSCVYQVFETSKDGSTGFVKLWISNKCCIVIPEEKLYYIVRECEKIIEQLIEKHRESNSPKREGHSTSCAICCCGNIGTFKSSVTVIQECTDHKPNDIASSLDADTNNHQPQENTDESKEPSTSQASACSSAHKSGNISESPDLDTEDKRPSKTTESVETKSKDRGTFQAKPTPKCSADKSSDIPQSPDPDTRDLEPNRETTDLDEFPTKSQRFSKGLEDRQIFNFTQPKQTPNASDIPQLLDFDTKGGQQKKTTNSNEVPTKFEEPSIPRNNVTEAEEFDELKKELINQKREYNRFYNKNKQKFHEEMEQLQSNCTLLYTQRMENKIGYKIFKEEQRALEWAYENSDIFDRRRGITTAQAKQNDALKITDLKIIKVELINPATDEVCATQMGAFDTGANGASYPCDPDAFKSLIHGVVNINDELTPCVYAKLKIDGQMLNHIFEIDIEEDPEWCAIGLEQIAKLDAHAVRLVMQGIAKELVLRSKNLRKHGQTN